MPTALELQHFAVLDLIYLHKTTAILITTTTNNPCHLTLYYTDKQPVRHATSLVKRGVSLPWGAYFCFVSWKSIEQQEAGDTLVHTFEVPDWSYCQTKWFTFRGTVASELSPSVTALLEHHHPGPFRIPNASFNDWPDPLSPPLHWEFFWFEVGPGDWGRLTRRDDIVYDPPYSAQIECHGYATGWGLRQTIDATPFRNHAITFTGWTYIGLRGYTELRIIANATIEYSRNAPYIGWQQLITPITIPPDATSIRIECRAHSGDYPLVNGLWDLLSLDF